MPKTVAERREVYEERIRFAVAEHDKIVRATLVINEIIKRWEVLASKDCAISISQKIDAFLIWLPNAIKHIEKLDRKTRTSEYDKDRNRGLTSEMAEWNEFAKELLQEKSMIERNFRDWKEGLLRQIPYFDFKEHFTLASQYYEDITSGRGDIHQIFELLNQEHGTLHFLSAPIITDDQISAALKSKDLEFELAKICVSSNSDNAYRLASLGRTHESYDHQVLFFAQKLLKEGDHLSVQMQIKLWIEGASQASLDQYVVPMAILFLKSADQASKEDLQNRLIQFKTWASARGFQNLECVEGMDDQARNVQLIQGALYALNQDYSIDALHCYERCQKLDSENKNWNLNFELAQICASSNTDNAHKLAALGRTHESYDYQTLFFVQKLLKEGDHTTAQGQIRLWMEGAPQASLDQYMVPMNTLFLQSADKASKEDLQNGLIQFKTWVLSKRFIFHFEETEFVDGLCNPIQARDAQLIQGMLYALNEEYSQEALICYERCQRLDPENKNWALDSAWSHIAASNWELALSAAASLPPENRNMIIFQVALNRYNDFIGEFKKLITEDEKQALFVKINAEYSVFQEVVGQLLSSQKLETLQQRVFESFTSVRRQIASVENNLSELSGLDQSVRADVSSFQQILPWHNLLDITCIKLAKTDLVSALSLIKSWMPQGAQSHFNFDLLNIGRTYLQVISQVGKGDELNFSDQLRQCIVENPILNLYPSQDPSILPCRIIPISESNNLFASEALSHYALLAQFHLYNRRFDAQAVQDLTICHQLDPNPQHKMALLRAYLSNSNWSAAEELEATLQSDEYYTSLAHAYLEVLNLKTAASYASKAPTQDQENILKTIAMLKYQRVDVVVDLAGKVVDLVAAHIPARLVPSSESFLPSVAHSIHAGIQIATHPFARSGWIPLVSKWMFDSSLLAPAITAGELSLVPYEQHIAFGVHLGSVVIKPLLQYGLTKGFNPLDSSLSNYRVGVEAGSSACQIIATGLTAANAMYAKRGEFILHGATHLLHVGSLLQQGISLTRTCKPFLPKDYLFKSFISRPDFQAALDICLRAPSVNTGLNVARVVTQVWMTPFATQSLSLGSYLNEFAWSNFTRNAYKLTEFVPSAVMTVARAPAVCNAAINVVWVLGDLLLNFKDRQTFYVIQEAQDLLEDQKKEEAIRRLDSFKGAYTTNKDLLKQFKELIPVFETLQQWYLWPQEHRPTPNTLITYETAVNNLIALLKAISRDETFSILLMKLQMAKMKLLYARNEIDQIKAELTYSAPGSLFYSALCFEVFSSVIPLAEKDPEQAVTLLGKILTSEIKVLGYEKMLKAYLTHLKQLAKARKDPANRNLIAPAMQSIDLVVDCMHSEPILYPCREALLTKKFNLFIEQEAFDEAFKLLKEFKINPTLYNSCISHLIMAVCNFVLNHPGKGVQEHFGKLLKEGCPTLQLFVDKVVRLLEAAPLNEIIPRTSSCSRLRVGLKGFLATSNLEESNFLKIHLESYLNLLFQKIVFQLISELEQSEAFVHDKLSLLERISPDLSEEVANGAFIEPYRKLLEKTKIFNESADDVKLENLKNLVVALDRGLDSIKKEEFQVLISRMKTHQLHYRHLLAHEAIVRNDYSQAIAIYTKAQAKGLVEENDQRFVSDYIDVLKLLARIDELAHIEQLPTDRAGIESLLHELNKVRTFISQLNQTDMHLQIKQIIVAKAISVYNYAAQIYIARGCLEETGACYRVAEEIQYL